MTQVTATRRAEGQGGIWDKCSPASLVSSAQPLLPNEVECRGRWGVGDAVPRCQHLQGTEGRRMPLGPSPAHSVPPSSPLILRIGRAPSFSSRSPCSSHVCGFAHASASVWNALLTPLLYLYIRNRTPPLNPSLKVTFLKTSVIPHVESPRPGVLTACKV